MTEDKKNIESGRSPPAKGPPPGVGAGSGRKFKLVDEELLGPLPLGG